jgi:hypothetical protein
MKKNRSLTIGLIACVIAIAISLPASAQNMKQGKAKVVRKSGEARFTTGNNVWQPLKVGDVLGAGTIVQTAQTKGSYVDLVLGDGSAPSANTSAGPVEMTPLTATVASYQPKSEQNVVRIWENSAVGIDKLTLTETGADVVTDTQLDLRAGHIFGNVKKMSAASKYEIKIPSGVAGIRGTTYDLWVNGLFRIGKGSGAISILGSDGQLNSKSVPGGYEFDPSVGDIKPLPTSVKDAMNHVATLVGFSAPAAGFVGDQTIHFVSEGGETSATTSDRLRK